MIEIPLDESFETASNDEQRVTLLTKKIEEQERAVFALRFQLSQQEGVLEGLLRLREQLGAPTLSHKHTLRGRVKKYLLEHPETPCSDLARHLSVPITTMNMCLHRNKNLFEQTEIGWKCTQSEKT